MSIPENVQAVLAQVRQAAQEAGRSPEAVTLCAATKTQTDEAIRQAIAAGVTVCGENRVQELTAHLEAGAYAGAQVHFIGHLQTNKVKQVEILMAGSDFYVVHTVASGKTALRAGDQVIVNAVGLYPNMPL